MPEEDAVGRETFCEFYDAQLIIQNKNVDRKEDPERVYPEAGAKIHRDDLLFSDETKHA